MIIRYEQGKLRVYDCYRHKESLSNIGFRWNKTEVCWQIKATYQNIIDFEKHFKHIKIYRDKKVKDLHAEALIELGKREEKLKTLRDFKKSLFDMEEIDLEGFSVPPGFTPYKHQAIAMRFFYESPIGNLYGDCGVGKTAIMLWLTERLVREGKVNKVLVVCPKTIMRGAWEEDCKKFTPGLRMCVLDKSGAVNQKIIQRDLSAHPKYAKKYDKPFDVYVVNYEALKPLEAILGLLGFDMIIFDESSKLKNHKSSITKTAIKTAQQFKRRYVLCGTPAPNHETEYFGQMRVLDDDIFGTSFYKFREYYFEPIGFLGFQYELDPMLEDEFITKLYTYGLRFKQEDCVDLPPTQDIILPSFMDSKLSSTYKTLEKEKILELSNREIPVSNPLAEMTKLRQLASSHMIDDEGVEYSFTSHKLNTLKEFLENNPEEQVIIWACFKKDIESIGEMLGDKALLLYGKTSKKVAEYSKAFKNGDVQYIVCNAQSVGHGHTWTNSCINVLFSFTYSNELYTQLKKRTHRISQDKKVRYYHIISKTDDGGETIESILYDVVNRKISRANEIMDRFKAIELQEA